jgi:hypothetical protein
MTPKAKTSSKATPKVEPFLIPNPEEHYGSPAAQGEMDKFLSDLSQDQRSTIVSLQKIMQHGACFKCGYKKMLRYLFAWFQNHGTEITVSL